MKNKLLIALAAIVMTNVPLHAGTDSHGGDFDEMQFTSLGYEALDLLTLLKRKNLLPAPVNLQKLSEVLKTMNVSFVDEAKLQDAKRSAVNTPALKLIVVSRQEWQKWRHEPIAKFQLVLHELLPLTGLVDNHYQYTAPIVLKLKKLNAFDRLQEGHKNFSSEPVVLFATHWDNEKEGYELSDVQQQCGEMKNRYSDLYFIVYCEYLEKSWTEQIKTVRPETYTRRVRDGSYSLDETRKTWVEVEVPVEQVIYGLRVYGWNLLSQTPWAVIGSSLNLANGLAVRTFETAREAYRACREFLVESREDSSYIGAKCRSPKMQNQDRYYYEIVTQNPLATRQMQGD